MSTPASSSGSLLALSRAAQAVGWLFSALLWAGVAYHLISFRDHLLADERAELSREAATGAASIKSSLDQAEFFLQAADLYFQAKPHADPFNDPGFLALADDYRDRAGDLIQIRFLGQDGLMRQGVTGDPWRARDAVIFEANDRDYYAAMKRSDSPAFFIGDPVRSRDTGLWLLPIARRLASHPSGMMAIVLSLPARMIEPELSSILDPRPDKISAVASLEGSILFSNPSKLRGLALGSDPQWSSSIRVSSSAYETSSRLLDDRARLVGVSWVMSYPFAVLVSTSLEKTLAPLMTRAAALIPMALLLSLSAIALSARARSALLQARQHGLAFERESRSDFLTGLLNRRGFFESAQQALELSRSQGFPCSAIMIDVDLFKRVNDAHGHEGGDRALRSIAQALQADPIPGSVVGRTGGEEFALLLSSRSDREAFMIAERLREAIKALRIPMPEGSDLRVTVSAGVAQAEPSDSLDQLLNRADQALYAAKALGRDQSHVFDSALPPASVFSSLSTRSGL